MAGRSPTITTLTLFVIVFLGEVGAHALGLFPTLFLLAPPVGVRPWTIVTSVYAHGSVTHLLANSVALLAPGLVLERQTTPERYHAFFIASGALAGVVQVVVASAIGPATSVLGASGAVLAVIGYLLAANRLSERVIGGIALPAAVQAGLFGAIAVGVTVVTAGPGVALIAHFTGFCVGLAAGRAHLLRP